jgi:hypothetical protein
MHVQKQIDEGGCTNDKLATIPGTIRGENGCIISTNR